MTTQSSNPKKNHHVRRRRPNYPALQVGQSVTLNRKECEAGQFIFTRLFGHKPPRSRHLFPHEGRKEQAKRKAVA